MTFTPEAILEGLSLLVTVEIACIHLNGRLTKLETKIDLLLAGVLSVGSHAIHEDKQKQV